MTKPEKIEIVIPTWVGRTGSACWGDGDYSGYDNDSTSFWVSFRGVLSGNAYGYMTDECRAVGDIGLYVYVTVIGTCEWLSRSALFWLLSALTPY
jgi:hypothetical protein